MIKNTSINLFVSKDPLSFISGIDIVNGSLRQSYDSEYKEYVPDRRLIPLKLLPYVNIKETGSSAEIKKVNWYYNVNGQRVNILSLNGFDIDNENPNMLVITTNTPAEITEDTPTEIIAEILFVDPRDNIKMTCEHSVHVHTLYYASHSWKVELDQPFVKRVDPTVSTIKSIRVNDLNMSVPITATLYDGSYIVTDNVAYFWYYYDGSELKPFNTDCHWLNTKIENGMLGRTVDINIDAVNELKIRCYCEHYSDTIPQLPTKTGQFAETFLKRQMPINARAFIIPESGTHVENPTLEANKKISMHVEMLNNNTPINNFENYYHIDWGDNKTGKYISKSVKDFGLSHGNVVKVQPDIYELGNLEVVKTSEGVALENYTKAVKLTTPNGTYIVARKKI